ncbi:NAD-dependent protein deacetylase sirtuin-2 [Linnemannia zychae]|nr:NAD-dependent protein deacetylase sirtuin-2 [Linnemannia zychae]
MTAPRGSSKLPKTTKTNDGSISSIAEYINNGHAKNIIVMTGAGISTAAGIKDFRSPGTGLYDDLERFNLPYPEAVFDISFFKKNPSPFYRLAKELLPGRYRPTFTHYLLPLLAKKGLLLRAYTQNIDMLERLTGLDEELLVEAHGSFATSECIKCHTLCDNAHVRKHIIKSEIPHCTKCKGLIKPTITFFGENLPDRFSNLVPNDFKKCDLLIVLGTSLQVGPFNTLITRVSSSCPRVLINRERAGEDLRGGFDFEDKYNHPTLRDALFLGNCDDGIRQLAKLCGWEGELQAMFEAGNIEMALAEELEALTLAKEAEEEQKEIEEREKAEEDKNKDKNKTKSGTTDTAAEATNIDNVLTDSYEHPPVTEEEALAAGGLEKEDKEEEDKDVDAITDRLKATDISSEKDLIPAKKNMDSK